MQKSGSTRSQSYEKALVVWKGHWTQASDRKDVKAFYAGLKSVFDPQKSGVAPISTADGETLLTDKSDILNRWKEHFETVLNTTSVTDEEAIQSIEQNRAN